MKLKTPFFYILFFIAAFFAFAFVLFPQKELAAYLSRTLTDMDSNIDVSIDYIKPGLPFKLKLENTRLDFGRQITIVPDFLNVSLDIFSIFKHAKLIKIQSGVSNGLVKGRLHLDTINPLLFSDIQFVMSGMKINDFRYKTQLADIFVLTCEIDGNYKQEKTSAQKKTGQGTIHIQNFSAQIKDSLFNILNLPTIDFSDIELEFTRQMESITITRCIAKGSIINLNLKGNIYLGSPVQESRLNLTGVILPDSPYLANFINMAEIKAMTKNIVKGGIKFNIKGTLKNPKIGI